MSSEGDFATVDTRHGEGSWLVRLRGLVVRAYSVDEFTDHLMDHDPDAYSAFVGGAIRESYDKRTMDLVLWVYRTSGSKGIAHFARVVSLGRKKNPEFTAAMKPIVDAFEGPAKSGAASDPALQGASPSVPPPADLVE